MVSQSDRPTHISNLIPVWMDSWSDGPGSNPQKILAANCWLGSGRHWKQITYFEPMPWHEVIGVGEVVRHNGADAPAPAIVYWPTMSANLYGPGPLNSVRGVAFVIRSQRAGAESYLQEVQQAVRQINDELPVSGLRTMREIDSRSLARASFTLTMVGIAAALALALGVIGIYGVISYSVSQRMREMGIRIALGAQKSELRWLFVRSALVLTGIGVVIGLCAAAAVAQLMRALLFGIHPLEHPSFAMMALVLVAAAAVAIYWPVSRIFAINTADVLKAE